MADVFVSYARADKARVAPLVAAMEAKGWSVWWDPEIAPGREFDDEIDAELQAAKAVLVVWTPVSVASRWVRGEARDAAERGLFVPVRFDGARLPIDVRAIHTTDLDDWHENAAAPCAQECLHAIAAMIARTSSTRSAGAGKSPASPEEPKRISICVLPFVNMSGDPDNEYFSDGISEEILNLLTKLPQLKVSSRTSSFAFKGKDINIPMVAKELGVSKVLEGSVRRAGERVRITAQLIETESDSHLWSETYSRELKDVFAIQDDIARSIADALKVALSPKERRALQNVATGNPQAYDFYLRGRRNLYSFTTRDFHSAISMFERAIELDPRYALAYAGKADAYSMLYRYAEATPQNLQLAEQASRQAIELDPDAAETQASLGGALFITGRYAEAAEKFETAILINPQVYEPYLWYGRACLAQGDFEKAARLFTRASEVNPADYQTCRYLAMAYRSMGREDLAQRADAHTLEVIERRLKLDPDDARALSFGASVLASQNQRQRAMEWAEAALHTREYEPHFLYNVGCAFAQLGETKRALDLLERAIGLGWGDRAWIENDSDLASLQAEPRFQQLLEQMG